MTMTTEFKAAAKKDIEGMKAKWLLAGTMQDRAMADAAVAEFKAYVDMLATFGISLAHLG